LGEQVANDKQNGEMLLDNQPTSAVGYLAGTPETVPTLLQQFPGQQKWLSVTVYTAGSTRPKIACACKLFNSKVFWIRLNQRKPVDFCHMSIL
jgi:hypothetical protein